VTRAAPHSEEQEVILLSLGERSDAGGSAVNQVTSLLLFLLSDFLFGSTVLVELVHQDSTSLNGVNHRM